MTIEDAEEYLQTWSQGNGDTPNAEAAEEAKKVIIDAIRKGGHVVEWIRCEERLPEMPLEEFKSLSKAWLLSEPVLVCGSGQLEPVRRRFDGLGQERERRTRKSDSKARRDGGREMKKRISIALLFAVALSGCRQYKTAENVSYDARFVIISKELYGCIVYDEKTGVEYWRSEGNTNGTLTLLVDKDGKPLIYEGE